MSHANARTIPAGWPSAHIAAATGVSRKCVRTWVVRFAGEGVAGLVDRSSRLHTHPTATPPKAVAAMLTARRDLRWGPEGITEAAGVPARTVSRVLVRHGVPGLAPLDRISGELIRSAKQTAVRTNATGPAS